jgi:hypothetical protein
MLFRERQHEPAAQPQGGAPGAPGAGNLDRLRETGESLFRAADSAIERALSGDSQAFLHATQQDGGQ